MRTALGGGIGPGLQSDLRGFPADLAMVPLFAVGEILPGGVFKVLHGTDVGPGTHSEPAGYRPIRLRPRQSYTRKHPKLHFYNLDLDELI